MSVRCEGIQWTNVKPLTTSQQDLQMPNPFTITVGFVTTSRRQVRHVQDEPNVVKAFIGESKRQIVGTSNVRFVTDVGLAYNREHNLEQSIMILKGIARGFKNTDRDWVARLLPFDDPHVAMVSFKSAFLSLLESSTQTLP